MRWVILTVVIALCPAGAAAQLLLEIDGVELHGTARRIMPGASVCNVLETDTSYEQNKANHGAPMDVWRLDFSVRNGSGRWLDHIIARYEIASEWPDCTNWSGPDDAQFRALNSDVPLHELTVQWSSTIGSIQESGRNVVRPGQTLTTTAFLIVLSSDPEPRFSNWSMDFNFGADAPPGAGSPAAPPAYSAEQDNLFWQSIMSSTDPADFEAYLEQFPGGAFRRLAENRLATLPALASDTSAAAGRLGGGPGAAPPGTRARTDEPRRPGDVFRDCDECPEMVVMPGGGLALGRYEVTVGEYRAFASAMGGGAGDCHGESWRDPGFPQTERHPVTCVSWNDAREYLSWLSRTAGATYRLPTVAERDSATAESEGECYEDLTGNLGTCPVGLYGANGAGLYDMVGNVWEWTQDCWEGDCDLRVLHGGSWWVRGVWGIPGARNPDSTGVRNNDYGFRVARALDSR